MADRVVSVSIRAEIAGYLAGMEKVRAATAKTSDEAQKLEKQSAAFEKVGAGLLTIGAAAAAAVALTVKSFADFDAQMSQVQSLSHATATEMDTLRNAALTMGQGIGFSATQVADAETELVKAGVSVKDIMGGALKGALDLAAAGQINVADATEIAATAMTQFGLSGKDIPHVADLLAAGADKSLGGVEELGAALKQSGLVAAQFGLSIDDTVGTLSEFAAAGLMGSDAGTSLKQMFLQLATPSKQAADAMKQYHISAYDAQGDFVGMTSLADQLQKGFAGVDDASRDAALGIIFGSDAIRAANILYTDGAKGNQKWISSVNDAGFAARQAAGKMDNLNGDVKKLGAAFESGLIKSGSSANDILRSMTQNATGFIKAVSDAPPALQGVGLGLTALVAATALAGGGFLSLVPKIAAARAAMKDLQLSGAALGRGFATGGVIALGLYAITAGIAGLGKEAQLTDSQIAKLNAAVTASNSKSLNQQFTGGGGAFDMIGTKATTAKQALDSLTKGLGPTNVAWGKFFDNVFKTGTSDTATRFAAQFKQMGTILSTTAETDLGSATKGFNSLLKEMGGGKDTAKRLLDQMEPYKAELIALAGAQGKTLSETELLNLAQGKGADATALMAASTAKQKEDLQKLAGAASDAKGDIEDLSDTIKNFGSAQFDVDGATRSLEQAVDDFNEKIKESKPALDDAGDGFKLTEQSGRDAQAAIEDIAKSTLDLASATYTQTGSQEKATAVLEDGRKKFIDAATAAGISKDAANKYADSLGLIPGNVSTVVTNTAAAAGDTAAQYKQKLDALPKSKQTQINAATGQASSALQDVLNKLAGVQSKTITITTNQVTKATKENTVGIFKNARGSLMDFYANGGLREKHVAQIAPAGSMRLWAEPETGGEAYIPLASSKRKRSLAIWEETGRRLDAFADGGLVSTRTKQDKAAKARYAAAKVAQRRAQSAFNKQKTEAARQRLLAAQRETSAAQKVAQRAAAALTAAKNAPTGADLGDRISFRSSVRAGDYSSSDAVRDLYSMGQDSGKYSSAQRTRFLDVANRSETIMLKLQKQSTAAADAVEKASDKLGDLKSSASSMASAVSGKLSDFSYGNYRSGSSLLRGLTSRAGKLKQFQALLVTLQKNGLAPALLNEVASLGVDEGLPLAKSLSSMSKGQLSAINSQYNSIQKTSTAIGGQVADANYKGLIDAAEKQLSAANKNAAAITKAINDQSKSLQKLIGKALGLPGYSAGGYTGDYGTSQVAGLVHGREFVMNQFATAANRPLLEAMNRGGNVRYMDTTRTVAAAPAAGARYEQHNHFQPMQNVDGPTLATVVGRETARAMAGMVE